ncbi:MAG: hypothetical protein IIA64_04890 [Planctomycetes bacterium]|nr:hypothetical protein [Planctomycetota bacterium]
MNLFTINHSPNGKLKPCVCEAQKKSGYAATNQINLDNLTELAWEDGMWLVYFGDIYYRVHDKEKMAALEKALDPTEPED